MNLAQFTHFEIHPNLYIPGEDDTKGYYERCTADDPNLFCWTVYGHIPPQGTLLKSDPDLLCIADCQSREDAETLAQLLETHRANVQLFAAAPELLECCKEFVAKVDRGEAKSVRSYQAMKAALAKATAQSIGR